MRPSMRKSCSPSSCRLHPPGGLQMELARLSDARRRSAAHADPASHAGSVDREPSLQYRTGEAAVDVGAERRLLAERLSNACDAVAYSVNSRSRHAAFSRATRSLGLRPDITWLQRHER